MTSARNATSCECWLTAAAALTVVPAKASAADVLALNPDGIFLSNGPGDPAPCDYAIEAIEKIP
ncbi:glutamine amidotransferase-related protein [Klebsiella pneumoniae]|uniref:glutamine amidotransferase-related protein n=1 Tax=Klebsiella pneumoniae TaxID=573 RepID=UPI0039764325